MTEVSANAFSTDMNTVCVCVCVVCVTNLSAFVSLRIPSSCLTGACSLLSLLMEAILLLKEWVLNDVVTS